MINLKNRTLAEICLVSSAEYKEKTAFSMLCDGKITKKITYSQFGNLSNLIAHQLRQLGVKKQDRVILLSENSCFWPIAYFGIALADAVCVPLLTGFSNEQIKHIIEHSEAKAVCLGNHPSSINLDNQNLPIINIDNLPETNETVPFYLPETNEDEMAVLIYTSGTQGNSKGVMLSGKNLITDAMMSRTYVKLTSKDKMLSVLPLAHSYECTLGLLAPVLSGASVTYLDKPPSPSVLLPALKLVKPTAMLTVPLLIEKIYRASIKPKLEKSKLYNFKLTQNLAIRAAGKKLCKALGGRLRFFGIGGAPLSPEVEEFLYKARFPYSIGYGLTEASPLIAGNAPKRFKLNSGIYSPKDISVRIQSGEIQAKGPNIMIGYYKDEEKTKETITEDGWLRTGDLGLIDKKDRLHIKGRLKALILGPSGENIYPEEIEHLLSSSFLVEESLVYAGDKGEIVALVRLTDTAKNLLEKGASAMSNSKEAAKHALEELKAWVNNKLSGFSRINRIDVKEEPFEKTPTMKIKRYLYKD